MTQPVAISNTALVQFLDRVAGVDVETMKAAVAGSLDRAHRAADQIGAADYTVRIDGRAYVVRDGVLVAVHDRQTRQRR